MIQRGGSLRSEQLKMLKSKSFISRSRSTTRQRDSSSSPGETYIRHSLRKRARAGQTYQSGRSYVRITCDRWGRRQRTVAFLTWPSNTSCDWSIPHTATGALVLFSKGRKSLVDVMCRPQHVWFRSVITPTAEYRFTHCPQYNSM